MSEQRLIDANKIKFIEYINGSVNVEKEVIDRQPTIDPETLPIVQELRAKLENAEKEIERLKGVAKPNCISCDMQHQNGNCLSVGGFCTAVPAAYCPLIPNLRNKLEQYEKAEHEGRLVGLQR